MVGSRGAAWHLLTAGAFISMARLQSRSSAKPDGITDLNRRSHIPRAEEKTIRMNATPRNIPIFSCLISFNPRSSL